MNTNNIILSALSADAYSLGAHWVYDEEQLKNLPINWEALNDAQAMWHKDKLAGDFTHYGDQTLFLLEYISKNRNFKSQDYYEFWSEKMRNYTGYIDGATRNALENMGSVNNDLSITGRFAPLLLLSQTKDEFFNHVKEITQITHNSALATTTTQFFAQLLWESSESQNIIKSIQKIKSNYPLLEKWIEAGLNSQNSNTFSSIRAFGPACGIDGGFAGVIHLLTLNDDFTSVMIKNAKAGGDSSSRAMITAMILATQDDFMMNEKWLNGMNNLQKIQSHLN